MDRIHGDKRVKRYVIRFMIRKYGGSEISGMADLAWLG